MNLQISIRQTWKGDWLIFQALLARSGDGMVTGHQFGRRPQRDEALALAQQVAQENGGEVVDFTPCDPCPPGEVGIPWDSSMYEYIRRDELPLDKYGRPITGYCRVTVDGINIYPRRETVAEVNFVDEIGQYGGKPAYVDLVDGVLYTVRRGNSYDGDKILHHTTDREAAIRWLDNYVQNRFEGQRMELVVR